MRFLENMVSDMVKQSTGFNPKRMIRMIGGKNILMAGAGAVLAGTLANAGKGQGAGQGQGSGRFSGVPSSSSSVPNAAPPPPLPNLPPLPGSSPTATSGNVAPPPVPGHAPPPLPTATAPPPLPGVAVPDVAVPDVAVPTASAEDADADFDPQVVFAIVRTMVGAALSDGHLAPEEKAAIQGRLSESGLDEEKVRQIHQDLVLPPAPAELAQMASDPETRETLFRFAALVVVTDQQVSDLERRWLDRLAEAFELSPERKQALEEATLGAMQESV